MVRNRPYFLMAYDLPFARTSPDRSRRIQSRHTDSATGRYKQRNKRLDIYRWRHSNFLRTSVPWTSVFSPYSAKNWPSPLLWLLDLNLKNQSWTYFPPLSSCMHRCIVYDIIDGKHTMRHNQLDNRRRSDSWVVYNQQIPERSPYNSPSPFCSTLFVLRYLSLSIDNWCIFHASIVQWSSRSSLTTFDTPAIEAAWRHVASRPEDVIERSKDDS